MFCQGSGKVSECVCFSSHLKFACLSLRLVTNSDVWVFFSSVFYDLKRLALQVHGMNFWMDLFWIGLWPEPHKIRLGASVELKRNKAVSSSIKIFKKPAPSWWVYRYMCKTVHVNLTIWSLLSRALCFNTKLHTCTQWRMPHMLFNVYI